MISAPFSPSKLRLLLPVVFLCTALGLLVGCGGSNTITTTPPAYGDLFVTPSTISFSSVTVGSNAVQTLTLSNNGQAPLSFTSITLSDTTDYTLANACGTLAVSTSCAVTVTFKPQSVGSFPATLVIDDSNAENPTQTITLSGAGVASPTAVAALSANSISFGSVQPGTTTGVQSIYVSNSGNAALNITSIGVADPADYTFNTTCGTTLTAGSSCSISVAFRPQTAGPLNSTLTLVDNAPNSPQTVTLTGTGTPAPAPAVTLSATSVVFPTTIVGTTSNINGITLTNSGSAPLTLTGLTVGGTGAPNFTAGSSCGTLPATLAVNASCTISATFTPAAAQTYNATIGIADNAPGSPQSIALIGPGIAPAVTLSPTGIAFPTTTVRNTSAASSVTLTNSGTAALTLSGITLGGANPSDFATTNTCGATLAIGAACTISATFTPAAAQSYTATITLTDNAANSPQAITLSGTGAAATSTVTRTLYAFPEPDNSVTPLYALVAGAQKTIDMTMYELQDTTFDNDLIAACARGVRVRVILSSSEKSNNTPAYTALNTASTTSATAGANCSAVLSNTAFTNTHQKTITIDSATTAIMTLNLQSQYYSTTRDFALVENDTADIAAIEATFAADYAAGTPYNGTQGASDFSYTPALGDDLIWSPTTAQAAMESIINNAKSTLLIENEELASSASYIVTDLVNACQRGVVVHFTIVYESSYATQLTAIKNAGCSVHTYADTATGFYVHAKVVVADYGASSQNVYLGSINYSNASMNMNRELGMYLSDNAAVQTLYTTLTADYTGGTPY